MRNLFLIALDESSLSRCTFLGLRLVDRNNDLKKVFLDLDLKLKTVVNKYQVNGVLELSLEFKFYVNNLVQITDKQSLLYYYRQIMENFRNVIYLPGSEHLIIALLSVFLATEFGAMRNNSYEFVELLSYCPFWLLQAFDEDYLWKSIGTLQEEYPITNRVSMMKNCIYLSQYIPELSTHFIPSKLFEPSSKNQTAPPKDVLMGISSQFLSVYLQCQHFHRIIHCYEWLKLSKIKFQGKRMFIEIADIIKKYRRPIVIEFSSKHEASNVFKLCRQTSDFEAFYNHDFPQIKELEYLNPSLERRKESLVDWEEGASASEEQFSGARGLRKWRLFSENSSEDTRTSDVSSTNQFNIEVIESSVEPNREKAAAAWRVNSDRKKKRTLSEDLSDEAFDELEKGHMSLNVSETFDVPFAVL